MLCARLTLLRTRRGRCHCCVLSLSFYVRLSKSESCPEDGRGERAVILSIVSRCFVSRKQAARVMSGQREAGAGSSEKRRRFVAVSPAAALVTSAQNV